MNYDNTFSMEKYFQKNYGLPAKPQAYKFKKKPFLILILFCWIWIPLAILGKMRANKMIKAWEDAFEYRRMNWPYEYDEALNKAFKDMKLYESALKKIGVVEEELKGERGSGIEPFYISGSLFDGFWRKSEMGTYRTSRREYTYVVCTNDQVFFYRRILDLLDLERKKESTLEFFYSDITSVNISTASVAPRNAEADSDEKPEELDVESFVLVVPGDKISMAFETNEYADASIKGMRNLIRDKKTGKA